MNKKNLACLSSFIIFTLTTFIQTTNAEVYHWLDADGKEHYSSRAPKSAAKVGTFKGKPFSRYSSSKLLKPYNNFAPKLKVEEKDIIAKTTKADLNNKSQARASLADEPILTEIEKSEVSIELTDDQKVKSCSITLKNTSTIPATNILVSFEFEDGTLIPASGADSIAPNSSAVYKIAEDTLPLSVKPLSTELGIQSPKVDVKVGG
ncbi:MAG: DUF4124 domain-containing protein [Proteobacteria bacterium]|nr:DUF4124 domain-containing protein [Pseudomonadota bacterium]